MIGIHKHFDICINIVLKHRCSDINVWFPNTGIYYLCYKEKPSKLIIIYLYVLNEVRKIGTYV